MKSLCTAALVFSFYMSTAQNVIKPDSLRQLVLNWNEAHNTKDTAAFSRLYDSNVFYYGTHLAKVAAINGKINFLVKNPSYIQQIIGIYLLILSTKANGNVYSLKESRLSPI